MARRRHATTGTGGYGHSLDDALGQAPTAQQYQSGRRGTQVGGPGGCQEIAGQAPAGKQ